MAAKGRKNYTRIGKIPKIREIATEMTERKTAAASPIALIHNARNVLGQVQSYLTRLQAQFVIINFL